nr:cis-3-alkyl-4-alkyloxetan-2-one decarboxylase isoform X2 [Ziziphus jujuba var. spinosa]
MALAWAPLLPRPLSHQPSSPISTKSNKTCLSLSWNTSISTGCTKYRASTAVITKATADDKDQDSDSDQPAFNPFGFVTNNPSSRSAIQLPESPAEDGNVGQMLYLSELGFHCFAPDWIGFGFSDKPQPGYGFDYTEKEFHEELDRLLAVLGIESPFYLVVQGFLVGSYGLTWALKNPSRISKIAILNSPVTVSSPTPGLFQKLRIPLYGEFTSQNAIIAERFIEAGSPYVLKLEKADVYRLPYLSSSGPGFALLEAARKANFSNISSQIAAGFASGRWDKPVLLAWGISDKYLPQSVAEEFQKGNPDNVKLKLIEGAGHMPQEDWPEKVVEALCVFF